jgi:hypothetical protein
MQMHKTKIIIHLDDQAKVLAIIAIRAGGLLGAAGTGTLISTLHGCALTSASLASITGSVAGGTAVITGASAAAGTAAGAAIDKVSNKNKK